MSIRERIKARIREVEGKGLRHLPSSIASDLRVRDVFVSDEVWEMVTPPWSENWEGQRHQSFRGSLDAFTRGEEISVSENPFEKRWSTFLARVHPIEKEVWDIRTFEPNPGTRCFGHFGDRNLFITLTWQYRENLEGGKDWDDEVSYFVSEWKKLFCNIPPFIGRTVDDLLSNYHPV